LRRCRVLRFGLRDSRAIGDETCRWQRPFAAPLGILSTNLDWRTGDLNPKCFNFDPINWDLTWFNYQHIQ
jgi:hypothetical protein